ncbi:YjbH domain-containing protein [Arcobacter roscoffensis]|uniref:YjbH domain-containing protein n=1 Tax=Arcobacter roscoffensis TaxID=2961520 RepID=A0ABY5E6D8_9BACT|nr:YjbH domain-containing protein [Arcobacter roscoffensis]UTJ07320.1 YjbH domain-containing protein [Arcobacter roscoffensis]
MNLKTLSILPLTASFLLAAKTPENITATYSGNTGVFETPNARIMKDWSMRFFLNEDKPYRYYGLTATPLPFIEANFHMTQVSGVAGFSDSEGYGSYKDKSLSVKFLLKKEGEYTPALAIGADDIWGTSLYTSKYLVLSKNIGYFDLSLGYAKGRLGGEDLKKYEANSSNSGSFDNNSINFLKNTDWGGGKPFGSVVFNASPSFSLMAEYAPIDYAKDKVNPYTVGDYELPKSKFNYGLKYKYSNNSIFNLSYQRGNTISFGYTYQFGFDRTGMFDHLPDPRWKASDEKKAEYKNLNEKELSDKLSKEVAAEKFKYVKTAVNENSVWTEIDNPRYYNELKAAGRAISAVDEVAPKKYDTIYMTIKDKEIKKKTIKVNRAEFDMYENQKVSDAYMRDAILISNDTDGMYEKFSKGKDLYISDSVATEKFRYKFAPKIGTMLNHKDKPFAMKISMAANASYEFTDNFEVHGSIEHPLYHSGTELSSSPLEEGKLSLRGDITEHFTYNDTQMSHLSMVYKANAFNDSFFKAELGYLEYSFAGVDLEWYKPMFDERFGIGLQYQNVYKREVDELFGIKDEYKYDAKFLNLYYLVNQKYDLHMGAKIGQFLAGDKGIRLEVARNYKNFTFGAFATYTDSKKVFENEDNKGYIDKGVYIKVPLEVFTYKNVKDRLRFGLTPWTRDVGVSASTLDSLYPMNNSENNTQIMKKYINNLRE